MTSVPITGVQLLLIILEIHNFGSLFSMLFTPLN